MRPDDDLASLLGRADTALYRSKAAGRDRVTVA
jgi:PleD family two-component response regulator